MRKKKKVLLLEDNLLFAQTLQEYLEDKNFIVDISIDGEEALQKSYYTNYDLYLLDVKVPKINGMDFLKMLRESGDERPAMFITSYQDLETLKKGYMLGCDDYMKKPIDLEELSYRIEVLLKSRNKLNTKMRLNDKYYYDFKQRTIFCDDIAIKVSMKAILLLEIFLENRSKVVTKEQIVQKLWSSSDEYSDGSIRVYVNKLKSIIGKKSIENIKGIGYKLT
ncbi:MAG: response regulator transcription factor [Sulfurospirillum sp.]